MHTLIIKAEGKKFNALVAFLNELDISFQSKETENAADKAFIKKIKESQKQAKNGEYITMKDTENVWESILSK
jgi:hypothetical protein